MSDDMVDVAWVRTVSTERVVDETFTVQISHARLRELIAEHAPDGWKTDDPSSVLDSVYMNVAAMAPLMAAIAADVNAVPTVEVTTDTTSEDINGPRGMGPVESNADEFEGDDEDDDEETCDECGEIPDECVCGDEDDDEDEDDEDDEDLTV